MEESKELDLRHVAKMVDIDDDEFSQIQGK